jgi:hypothetical protein
LIKARIGILVLLALTACIFTSAVQARNSDVFRSPSGNLRCGYVDQVGVACIRMNDGRGVFLHSFDKAYYLSPWQGYLPAGRTLYYGQGWSASTFRCRSESNGVTCWSTLTHHGFFLNRSARQIF